MNKKSVKKYIYWGIFVLFVIGSIATGSPFNLIDMVVVRPIVNILFVIFNLVKMTLKLKLKLISKVKLISTHAFLLMPSMF